MMRLVLAFSLTLLFLGQAEAKRVVVPKMYMFGFAASFNDTVVHFTDVIEVDSVWIESKNKFLLGRNYYSHQFRDYLSTKEQMPLRTCVTVYAPTRAKAEKKLLKMRRLYTNSKDGRSHFDIRYVNAGDFKYKAINISEFEDTDAQEQPVVRKKSKNKKPKK